jgi:hypothetical protein
VRRARFGAVTTQVMNAIACWSMIPCDLEKFTDFLEGPTASLLCTCKADIASFSFASLKSKYHTHGTWCRVCILVEIRRCLEIPWSRTQQVSTKLVPRHISEDRTVSVHNCKMLDEWPFSPMLTSFWSFLSEGYLICTGWRKSANVCDKI